jgi:hypothetical protein
MKAFLFSLLVLGLSGCALPQFPKWPDDVKTVYVAKYDKELDRWFCGEFKIVSTAPLITEFVRLVEPETCSSLEGFLPDDMIKVRNWIDDSQRWAQSVRCKLK